NDYIDRSGQVKPSTSGRRKRALNSYNSAWNSGPRGVCHTAWDTNEQTSFFRNRKKRCWKRLPRKKGFLLLNSCDESYIRNSAVGRNKKGEPLPVLAV